MWAVENSTPFGAERVWVRDKDGQEVWIVVIKGTFTINPDCSLRLALDQRPIYRVPLYRGEAGRSSLLYDMDLVRTKSGTDVIVTGQAYVPHAEMKSETDVFINVGPITKRLRVFGDRYWDRSFSGMTMTPPLLFSQMPIIYERALGGVCGTVCEQRNPVGVGLAGRPGPSIGSKLPNVENPASLMKSWKDRPTPAGFGPIAGDWSPRRELAGTYDDAWQKTRQPLLPRDFDDRFYRMAPQDQQVSGYLKGGEPVEILGLTPHGRLRFSLPRVSLGIQTRFSTGQLVEQHAVIHTIVVEPDESKVILVWHTALPCHHHADRLVATRIIEKRRVQPLPGQPFLWGLHA